MRALLLLIAMVAISHCSLQKIIAKVGERVVLGFAGEKEIIIRVPNAKDDNRIFFMQGPLKGKLFNYQGQLLDSKNFEIVNQTLVIKKCSILDQGMYSGEQKMTEHPDGTMTAVPGQSVLLDVKMPKRHKRI